MKLKDLKISTQLRIGFAILLLFILALGTISYVQQNKMAYQATTFYKHPFEVRHAISELQLGIMNLRINERELYLSNSPPQITVYKTNEKLYTDSIEQQFQILRQQYLGPAIDIGEAYRAYTHWKTLRDENIKQAFAGDISDAKNNILASNGIKIYRDKMISEINTIDIFAGNKADELYAKIQLLNRRLNIQILMWLAFIIILSLGISYWLFHLIRSPLKELSTAVDHFRRGDMIYCITYQSNNEFGKLSSAFGNMVDKIKIETLEKEKLLHETMSTNLQIADLNRDLENKVKQRTIELQTAIEELGISNRDLEQFNNMAVGRELRMIELKQQINTLSVELGKIPPYDLSFVNEK